MKYLYYPDTLRYAGEVDDSLSIPFSLDVAPPAAVGADSVVVADVANGVWIVRSLNADELSVARTAKLAALASAYAQAIQQPVSFTTQAGVQKAFQADSQSVYNLQSMLLAFQVAGATPEGFYWVAADNTQVPFSYADMQGLAQVIGAQGALAFQHLQNLKTAVKDAATYSAIQAVTW
ncbi:DUF4376 domain-containing protein [Burkholderia territorii]|uniref:DUF4376 domain-containing protein n=1 Tax=Burkholderia territorii TaxID=1503055 RepID=UPI00075A14A7|nr:DUF4376 domain-containing protein [Burkholderia territorii]KWO62570.1 hypothetical protein WT98_30345 [Burkholderia territorii]